MSRFISVKEFHEILKRRLPNPLLREDNTIISYLSLKRLLERKRYNPQKIEPETVKEIKSLFEGYKLNRRERAKKTKEPVL